LFLSALATISALDLTPSFEKIRRKWVQTVQGLNSRVIATAFVGKPFATSRTISLSRGLKLTGDATPVLAYFAREPHGAAPARHLAVLRVTMDGAGGVVHFIQDTDGEVSQWLHAAAPVLLRRKDLSVIIAAL